MGLLRGLIVAAVALSSVFLAGCPKEDRGDDPYPLWLISVDVVEQSDDGSGPAVQGCPRLAWRYTTDQGDPNRVGCVGGNTVRTQNHIDSEVTVVYFVECDGYFPSEPRSVTFRPEDAVQRPGRGGPEVWRYDRIALLREP